MKTTKIVDMTKTSEPANKKVLVYERYIKPILNEIWFQHSDLAIQEIAKLLPNQMSFLCSMIHEYPQLLPNTTGIPGRIQELIFIDIMEKFKGRSRRNHRLKRNIIKLWVKNGGQPPVNSRRGG